MNERIQELAEQASFDVGQIMAEILCPDYDGSELYKLIDAYNALPKEIRSETVEIIRKKQEKFAELIVRECVAICETKRAEYTKLCKDADNFTDKNLWAEGEISAHRIRISIQEHFGVEE